MRNLFLFVLTVAAVAISASVVVIATQHHRWGKQIAEAVDYAGGVEYLGDEAVDHLVDRLNESGYGHEPIDPDEPMLKSRTILICEGMSERVARRVIERLVYLDAMNPNEPIELRIATSGGWLDSAFAIVDTMRAIRAPVNVTAFGGCYSAGTVILAAGTGKRRATPNALLSVHVNQYDPGGEYEFDTRELDRFHDVYRRYTEVPEEWFDAVEDHQWYLDADQALELRLIDEIAEPVWKPADAPARVDRPAA